MTFSGAKGSTQAKTPEKVTEVPLLDLKAQYETIRDEVEPVVRSVLESQRFIMGPEIDALEREIAEYCGARHAVGLSSGTDALLIALMALNIGPGDEVITSPYTFFATAGTIHRLGARPVFVDVEPDTLNIDPALIEAAVTPKTRAIIPVHLYGQCADMDAINAIARKHRLAVVEDAAQAIGAEYSGRRAGTLGDIGCFSFFPSKNLGGIGDGGMVTTDDDDLHARLRMLRVHGMEPKYYHHIVGGNFRLDAINAAVLRVKLRHLDKWTEGRQRNALLYDRLLAEAGLAGSRVRTPAVKTGRHVFNQYVIRVDRRDELMGFLGKAKIGVEIYYPVPLHLQECFSYLGKGAGSFPNAEAAAKDSLALPIYPELTVEQIEYVAEAISRFFNVS